MHLKLRAFAEQVLIAANIFVLFLLLFESKLVIPAWLQTIGRMHPLILHFPIVILLLAMLLEFFRFKPEYAGNIFYRNFLQGLLLIGALFAAVTVIMGLFLSKEEGYTGETLAWHKWTGAGIFFLSSLIYGIRNARWYSSVTARAGAMVTVAGLVLTGHYGASLTHGANFIWQPVSSQKQMGEVPLDEAVVYTNVIRPIFEQKCTSCHNPEKIKGELILTDPQSILKGGKSGKLIVPGNPQMSLLLQRVHLPMEEKKHMPPAGKAQLTAQEIALLSLWVKQRANFKQKLTELPETDSLRMLAASYLQPKAGTEEYDFEAADVETVRALNTDYRTILPLARESPALAVNIYNAAGYDVKQIGEMGDIRKQVISLNLNKLPVKDADLKSITQFENLRRLDLNFTDVTAAGLKELAGLKHLHTVTLSGTKLTLSDLKGLLPQWKSVKRIAVWDTKLSAADVQQLQQAHRGMDIIGGFKDDGKNPLKLNPPQMKNPSPVFEESALLDIRHPIKGVDVWYTLDGSEPDSIHSPVLDQKTVIRNHTTVRAKAYKNGWYGSDMVVFEYYKSAFRPDTSTLLAPLNRVHQAEGVKTFFDHKLGAIGANNPAWANNWAGARDREMAFVSKFKRSVTLSSLGLRYMVEEDTGIFPPEVVEIWGGKSPDDMKLLTKFKAPMPVKGERPSIRSVTGRFKPQQVSCIKIVARPLSKIPDWHRSKGNRALLLVDEMFLN